MEPNVTSCSPEMFATGMGLVFAGIFVLVWLLMVAFCVFLWCRICGKTGYHWALGFLILFPFGGALILLCVLAFATWPIQKELNELKPTQTE